LSAGNLERPIDDGRDKAGLTAHSSFVFYVDALLLVVFVLLLSPRLTGLPCHEWLGLSFTIPVLVHLLVARPWIRSSFTRVLRSKDPRTTVNLILNSLIFILAVIEIFSGLEISQVLRPTAGLARINDRSWRELHNLGLNWMVLVIGLHIAMNWEWITRSILGRLSRPPSYRPSRMRLAPSYVSAVGWIVLVLLVSSLVAGIAYAILGPPSAARVYVQDEVRRFSPTIGHGAGQFLGEAFMIAVVAFVARKWLRVRL
jgi:hypothetical protein